MLAEWKTNQMKKPKQTESLHLVAAEVAALYPTITKNLVEQALKRALQVVSPYSQKAIKSIVEMEKKVWKKFTNKNWHSYWR